MKRRGFFGLLAGLVGWSFSKWNNALTPSWHTRQTSVNFVPPTRLVGAFVEYSRGFKISKEAWKDDLYFVGAPLKKPRQLDLPFTEN